MLFTVMSILLSVFEYCLSSKFVNYASSIVISFKVESQDIAKMGGREFSQKIVFQRNRFCSRVAQWLNLAPRQIDRLNPMKTEDGAIYVLCISTDESKFERITRKMSKCISDGELSTVIEKLYKLEKVNISIETLTVVKLKSLYMNIDSNHRGSQVDYDALDSVEMFSPIVNSVSDRSLTPLLINTDHDNETNQSNYGYQRKKTQSGEESTTETTVATLV